ncbi:MAG: response regulator [Campylobacterales bacterium]|nr:response regulator [Campylobacterales bacterium]
MRSDLTILSIDDDVINLKLISSLLKKNVHVKEIIEAKNGLDALTILDNTSTVDAILLDIKMPIMDGLEFLDNIQSRPHLVSIPVVVITTDETKKREAVDKGAFDFLVKPIREVELSQKIEKIAYVLD